MSRRRGEFEHRTSIFEGAYRAWSHLGGVDPVDLSSSTAADLDPLTNPHSVDLRITPDKDAKEKDGDKPKGKKSSTSSSASCTIIDSSGKKRMYPYEPLPRTGLAHPFVQAIISPWLGPDAEHDDVSLGLTTLRTWWQHRRKGESSSAKSALGTEKMRSVVEGYTRHFFNLAYCIVMNDGEQPPRTLTNKIKECEKNGVKLAAMKKKEIQAASVCIPGRDSGASVHGNSIAGTASQLNSSMHGTNTYDGGYSQTTQSHNGTTNAMSINGVNADMDMDDSEQNNGGCCGSNNMSMNMHMVTSSSPSPTNKITYGDPNKTPVVFVSEAGDIQIAMVSTT